MKTRLLDTSPAGKSSPRDPVPTEVRRLARSLLQGMYPGEMAIDYRSERRLPFPCLVQILPVEDDGVTPAGESFVAAGKSLSERGLGFFHPAPLAQRYAVVTVERTPGAQAKFLVNLDRCRFTPQGWYESGGRFVRVVSEQAVT